METKTKIIVMVIFASLVLLSLNLVSADFWVCFEKGEVIDFCNPAITDRTCGSSSCKFCMSSYDAQGDCYSPGNFNACNAGGGQCSLVGGNSSIDIIPPVLTINNPFNGSVHTNRKILVNLSIDERADIYFTDINNGRGRWTRLCNDCFPGDPAYERTRSFKEGQNDIMFRAVDVVENEAFVNVTFFVDSKKPKVSKTSPSRGFANGFFEAQVKEDNPESLFLFYGNNGTFENMEVDLNSCTENRGRLTCETFADLSSYDGQEIDYWFNITDIAGNSHASRLRSLEVDKTVPIINDINYTVDGRRVEFMINITEINLDVVEYMDDASSRPKFRRMCSRLKDGICKKRVSLKEGNHSIDIQVVDEAGNIAAENIIINI